MISASIPTSSMSFPRDRGGERLADLDDAAGQAEMAKQRRSRPAAVSKHRRRDREDRASGEEPVIHVSSLRASGRAT